MHRVGYRKAKRTSMSMVSRSGEPAPSWEADSELTDLANECFRKCINEHAKPDLIKVFLNNSDCYSGRCYVEQRIITISKHSKRQQTRIETLAHEIAHLRFKSHGSKHLELTHVLLKWLRLRVGMGESAAA